jgi:polysaccharide deacetylase 2 family uncharacterized protein YibQ
VLWIKKLCFLGLLLTSFSSLAEGKLALIIDDVGYNKQDIDAITLKGQLTYSVLPHTPFAKTYALMAKNANKDVMLHIPMESLSGKDLGPGALMSDMNRQQIQGILTNALLEIPFAKGINNHMGSLLTQKSSSMAWTMGFLQRHNLFFVDSRTSKFTVGEEMAKKSGVLNLRRNIFIDNIKSEASMKIQFNRLIRIVQDKKQAIGIAHPHPVTIKFLRKNLPRLKKLNIELVSVSSLLSEYELQLAKTDATIGQTE